MDETFLTAPDSMPTQEPASELRQRHVTHTQEEEPEGETSAAPPASAASLTAQAASAASAAATAASQFFGVRNSMETNGSGRRGSVKGPDLGGYYECNICFETATDAVITLCGHLFCWPCLHQWLEHQAQNPLCPVCKAGCGKDKVIPLYGRGGDSKDPRDSIPSRPPGQRPTPLRDPNRPAHSFFAASPFHAHGYAGSNFSVTAGFGFFPGLFGVQLTFPPHGSNPAMPTQQQAFLSRLFLMLGSLVLIAILLY
ncbi:hypothetical protein BZG36_04063 [Bifiguratus adelaidae]|uniref:RING-type E3 ubiquitin transferase n=1 Tax=Bifiguratus adelaidae TaxID=1938954 RepID=A0A261XXR9_9FUNG|nr:hypothetical protein BZG36_04063 [Bifiguratus adelaidae]